MNLQRTFQRKYTEYKPKACARSVFRARTHTPRNYDQPRKQLGIQIKISFVSAHKGKSKGKYIRFEHLTGETP